MNLHPRWNWKFSGRSMTWAVIHDCFDLGSGMRGAPCDYIEKCEEALTEYENR